MANCNDALPGLLDVLRQVRLRAGLTQDQVSAALGLGCRDRRTLVSRLERGKIAGPSLKFVLDYLRVCKAKAQDITQFLESYLVVPLPVPAAESATTPAKPRGPRVKPEDEQTRKLRKDAAFWTLLQVLEHMLHYELNLMHAQPGYPSRQAAVLFGRRVFRILYSTRQRGEAARATRLARARAWADRRALAQEAIEYLEDKVQRLFRDMKKDGDLEWLPLEEQAQSIMARCSRRRLLTDAAMCHSEFNLASKAEYDKLEKTRQPIIEGAKRLIRPGVALESEVGNYMGFVTGFINVARSTQPGSAERTRKLEELLRISVRPRHDPALVRRLADYVLAEWDRSRLTGTG